MRKTQYLIDDTSLEGTFGSRRIQLSLDNSSDYKLYKLKKAINGIGNFLLYTRIYDTFIDSSGKVFRYEKQTRVPLVYRKILKYVAYGGGTMLFIENTHCPIWLYRPINPGEDYAALLLIEKGYLLLGVTKKPNNKRTYFKI